MVNLMNEILVLGYSEASALLANPGHLHINALIAIHGRHEYPVEGHNIPHQLSLTFDDCDCTDESDPIAMAQYHVRMRESSALGLTLTPPTRSDAQKIIEFANTIKGLEGYLLCQCQGGVSRSAAAALLCLATWTEPGAELGCVKYLRAIRPCAAPHAGLVKFGDAILGRAGKLIAALATPT